MKNDIDYSDICRILKRYSFESKISICNQYSRKLIDESGDLNIKDMLNSIFPWELETFLLLCIKATPEYNDETFNGKNEKVFLKMINAIRNYEHPSLYEKHEDVSFADYFIPATGLVQFDIQEPKHYKMFRYNYIFTYTNEKIDMKKIFKDFYGISYDEFLDLGFYLILLYGSQIKIERNIFERLHSKFKIVFEQLSISIEDYKKRLDKITSREEDYLSCLRPSYTYPFLKKGNSIYLPLPHLIGRAVTSSLLYRLTEGNDALRQIVGKEVLEHYLVSILSEAKAYDEIYSEKEYIAAQHTLEKTLDAMVRVGRDFLFLDCKMAVPSIGIRTYNENSHINEIGRLAENVEQIYKHLRIKLPKHKGYNPFIGSPAIDIDNLWGITVVLEDSFIRRNIVYDKAAERLGLSKDSIDYRWLVNHIKVASMYDIERFSFVGVSLVDGLKHQICDGNPSDYGFSNFDFSEKNIVNMSYIQLIESKKKMSVNLTKELFAT